MPPPPPPPDADPPGLPAVPSTTPGATTPVATVVTPCAFSGPHPFLQSRMSAGAKEAVRKFGEAPPSQGGTAKRLAPVLATLKEDAFLAEMQSQVCATPPPASPRACCLRTEVTMGDPWGRGTQKMIMYNFEDGTVVRYKEKGDAFTSPDPAHAVATYSVEVKVARNDAVTAGQGDIACKVDQFGNAVPKGPGELLKLPANPAASPPIPPEREQISNAMGAGHRILEK